MCVVCVREEKGSLWHFREFTGLYSERKKGGEERRGEQMNRGERRS